jgi:TRAP-type C4-dicarboxylate transport system permease small subunit
VALLGAAVAFGRGAHLGIDYFVGKLPPRGKLATEVLVFLSVAAFSFLVMIVGGVDLVASNLDLGQESPALRVKMGYVYLAMPISGFFLTLYAIIGLVERLQRLKCGSVQAEKRGGL